MTLKELTSLSPNRVRRDNHLMPLFTAMFKEAFLIEPRTCCGGFKPDFKKLKRYAEGDTSAKKNQIRTLKNNTMAREFKIKRKFLNKILTYRLDGRTFRVYGKLAGDQFLQDYLTYGSKEELEARRLQFDQIPESWKPEVKPWHETSIAKTSQDEIQIEQAVEDGTLNLQQAQELTIKELKAYAKEHGIEIPKTTRKKADIIETILEGQL